MTLITGLGMKFGWVALPSSSRRSTCWPTIGCWASPPSAPSAEFFADKIAWVDSAWDAVHSFIRPLGGALLSLAIIDSADPAWQVGSFLLGGGAALVAHAGKAGARTLVNTSPEPFSNVVVSTGEDVATGGLLALAIANPIAAAIIALRPGRLSIWLVFAARRALRKLIDRVNPPGPRPREPRCQPRPARSALDAGHVGRGLVAELHRRIDPQCRPARDPRRDRRRRGRGPVGGQRLHPAARRADPARRCAWRPSRAAAVAGDRHRLVRLASLVCALSGSLEPLLAGPRASGDRRRRCCCPTASRCSMAHIEGEARGQAIGTWAAAGAIAAAIAPLIGGWLVEHVGWPSIFYINLPLVAAAIGVALTRVEEVKEPEKARLDLGGAVLATLGPRCRDLRPDALVAELRLTRSPPSRSSRRRRAADCLPPVGAALRQQGDGSAGRCSTTAASRRST